MSDIIIDRDVAKRVLSVVDAGLTNGLGVPVPGGMCVEAAVSYALNLPHSDDPRCVLPSLRALKISANDSRWSSREARAAGLRRLALAQLGSDTLDDNDFYVRVMLATIRTYLPRILRSAAAKTLDPSLEYYSIDRQQVADHLNADALLIESCPEDDLESVLDAAYTHALFNYESATFTTASYRAYTATSNTIGFLRNFRSSEWKDPSALVALVRSTHYAAEGNDYCTIDSVMSEFCESVVQILVQMNAPGVEWLDLAPFPSAAAKGDAPCV